jgi:N-acetylglutamate synthase-like GNAT family acetyltransferase
MRIERLLARFCDRRLEHVFVWHNGEESFYAARGFRGRFRV